MIPARLSVRLVFRRAIPRRQRQRQTPPHRGATVHPPPRRPRTCPGFIANKRHDNASIFTLAILGGAAGTCQRTPCPNRFRHPAFYLLHTTLLGGTAGPAGGG